MPITFRFRWIPFAASITVVALGIALAQWQTRRAAEKEAIERQMAARQAAPVLAVGKAIVSPEEVEFRRVRVHGEFVPDWPVYLDNRPYQGVAGFYVLLPLKIAGSDLHVLVERGWVKRDPIDRARLPPLVPPAGTIDIEGTARRAPGHLMQLGRPEPLHPGAIVQNLDIAEFGQTSRLPMQPFVIEQLTDTHEGLVRDWPKPSAGVEKHRGYAFQWYALAATAFVFFIVTGFRRGAK